MSDLFDYMRNYPHILQFFGVLGSILYVGGFALVQTGRICGNGSYYSFNQLTAATLVLISLVGAFNLGAFLIQIGFLSFGSLGLVRRIRMRRAGTYPPGMGVIRSVANEPNAPDPRGNWPAISDLENHQHAPGRGRPVQPCPAVAAPAP